MSDLLFVYGTLRSDGGQNWRLRGAALVGAGRMAGRLYWLGSYPAMIEARDADEWVAGEVYGLRDPEALFAELDEYEGSQYRRERRVAMMESGERTECWVYVYRSLV